MEWCEGKEAGAGGKGQEKHLEHRERLEAHRPTQTPTITAPRGTDAVWSPDVGTPHLLVAVCTKCP